MNRQILSNEQIDPEALKFIQANNSKTIQEIILAVKENKIVVIGMAFNPVVKKAIKILNTHKMEHVYLSYGGYFSKWQQRLAIKLWSGWPTFPQVFIDGKLVGGCDDLEKFLKNKNTDLK
jgi:glutaredoxin-related protein